MDPARRAQLLTEIRDSAGGGAGRDAAKAEIDADMSIELGQQLATLTQGILDTKRILGERVQEMTGELVETRKQMAASSVAASKHQRALVVWTAVLSFATIAYAVAAFLPFYWRSPASSLSPERAWVLWMESPVHSKQWSLRYPYDPPAFDTKKECDRAAQHAEATQASGLTDATKRGLPLEARSWYVCLPDAVDPRGPKGK